MSIEIKPVTSENLAEILNLKIRADQVSFIETPQQCIEEAKVCP